MGLSSVNLVSNKLLLRNSSIAKSINTVEIIYPNGHRNEALVLQLLLLGEGMYKYIGMCGGISMCTCVDSHTCTAARGRP